MDGWTVGRKSSVDPILRAPAVLINRLTRTCWNLSAFRQKIICAFLEVQLCQLFLYLMHLFVSLLHELSSLYELPRVALMMFLAIHGDSCDTCVALGRVEIKKVARCQFASYSKMTNKKVSKTQREPWLVVNG